MEQKKKIFLKKFLNVLSYVGIFVFFGFALVCAIFKFQGAKFNFFGSRYDVVLTNSMSEKSEKYKDFLEGHDDQFQAFDLVKSKPIEKAEDLKVYDVVIYNDRQIGTNMHRIVGIEEHGHDEVNYIGAVNNKLNEYDGIGLSNVESKIETTDLSFRTLEMVVYSEIGSEKHYNFSIINTTLDCEVSSVDAGNGKLVTYKVSRESAAPGQLTIAHSSIFDYSKETIVSLKIDAASGPIESRSSDVTFDGENGTAIYNTDYRFEIRGDAASDSDGYYSFNEIEARVVKNIPKAGYFVRFLNSIWGGLMFILLGCIFLGFDIASSIMEKKAKRGSENNSSESNAEVEPVKEEPKPVEPEQVKEELTEEPVKKQEAVEEPKIEEQPMVEEPKKEVRYAKNPGYNLPIYGQEMKPKHKLDLKNSVFAETSKKTPVVPRKSNTNSTTWTKENNPTANKKRAEAMKGEQK